MKLSTKLIIVASFACLSLSAFAGDLPLPELTPGAINPDVTQANIQQTICVKGFTKTIRPPQSYTNKLKKYQIKQYQYSDKNPSHYEEDHLIPLSIGGSPRDERNLWPQPRTSGFDADHKDELELKLRSLVCSGEVPLAEAQKAIASDWIKAYKKYGGTKYNEKHSENMTSRANGFALSSITHSVINRALRSLL